MLEPTNYETDYNSSSVSYEKCIHSNTRTVAHAQMLFNSAQSISKCMILE